MRPAVHQGTGSGVVIALWWAFCVAPELHSQMLLTAENGGRGSRSVMVAANGIQVEGLGAMSNNWLQYGIGLHGRLDAFVAYGNITALGRSQSYAAIGSNLGLLRRARAGLDVALYNNATIPFNHRAQACPVLLTSALIASRPVRVGRHGLSLYGGAASQSPMGRAHDPLFTSDSVVLAGIAGVSVPIGKNLALFFEYNPGGVQRSGGVGLLYTFPPKIKTVDPRDQTRKTPSRSPAARNSP